jgi:TetR/AcrR family transcriptional regulator, transcriptional repressor for nem operon
MKVTREQATENRERVVATAARLFRERGFDGIGIADLMREVGLTHGGFYAQFPSKEHLMAEAATKAADERETAMHKQLQEAPEKGVAGFAERYLSRRHRDNPGDGCYVATLGIDAARRGSLVRDAFTRSVQSALEILAQAEPAASEKERRAQAIADFAMMIGGMVLARAVSDEGLSDELLGSVKAEIAGRRPDTPTPSGRRRRKDRAGVG